MTRLSILIPFTGDVAPFEATLASVLQNTPDKSEVLVIHAGPYEDPYDLSSEVHFIEQPKKSSVAQLLNAGLDEALGDYVHVLRSGTEVQEGWTTAALRYFDSPQVGLVSPLLIDGTDPNRILARGVKYGIGGSRKLHGAGGAVTGSGSKKIRVLGPTLAAGFYRTEMLEAVGGFDSSIGDELTDVDVALAMHALGCECMFAEESHVRFTNPNPTKTGTFSHGRQAERLFWRHRLRHGGFFGLAMHPFTVLSSAFSALPSPGALMQLLGRSIACLEFGTGRRYEEKLKHDMAEFQADALDTLPLPRKGQSASDADSKRRAA